MQGTECLRRMFCGADRFAGLFRACSAPPLVWVQPQYIRRRRSLASDGIIHPVCGDGLLQMRLRDERAVSTQAPAQVQVNNGSREGRLEMTACWEACLGDMLA